MGDPINCDEERLLDVPVDEKDGLETNVSKPKRNRRIFAFPQKLVIQRERIMGVANQHGSIKLAVLIWLVLQNSVHTLLIRYSRARDVEHMFYSSVAVFFTEIIKAVICLYMVMTEKFGFVGMLADIKIQIFDQPWDTLKVCLPAMLYIVQNNLFYIAASHLEAATFMIVSQLKIFATALFSIVMLNRQLARAQWLSLAVLFIGVSLVQLQTSQSSKEVVDNTQKPLYGFMAACIGCTISGFAGVFFEKILKGSAPVSIWMRNVQMGVFAIPGSFIGTMIQDGANIAKNGFFYGFDPIVWFTVFWYGVGGLSVAVCIKYADNIAKNFATSLAIILATIGSVYVFGFVPNITFTFGAILVIFSIFLYSSSALILSLFCRHKVNSLP